MGGEDETVRTAPEIATQAARRFVGLIFFFGALEGLVFGYDTGVVAGALLFIRKEMDLNPAEQGMVVGALLLGSLIAAPISGFLSNRFGARPMLGLAGIFFLIGSLGAALAPGPLSLIGFRFILGLAVGVGSVQVPVYLAELSPAASRGKLTSLYQLMTAIGIFLAYAIGYLFAQTENWRAMFGVAAIPALLLVLGVLILPESPRWLVRSGRGDDALASLRRTRGADEAERDLAEIERHAAATRPSLRAMLADPWVRHVLLIALALAAFQQALGINTIVYYAPTILNAAGFGDAAAIFIGGTLQALSILSTFLLGRVVDRLGRRILLLTGALVMASSMVLLGGIFHFDALASAFGSGTAVACLAIFKAAFSASWGPIVWILLPELLPMHGRSTAMGACVFTVYLANFVISSIFPVLLASGSTAAFGTFALFGLIAFIFVLRLLPETSRRTLEEIEAAGKQARLDHPTAKRISIRR
ncbi:sugar porter family MFS transporter [Stakelama saccharophila]|uniref:Sugar porter family MFS transporter n=1 Tax=Stakelama saccharophila TaxID=3075605 RepID=A0ABZ0BD18_9SPHN|nr:sugar porter family MFS transporter [Stakelama sp. W311]WNO55140.1 sugar porter family MFS transporter [Stakelama sp. W311]